jgi:hypothetical protein
VIISVFTGGKDAGKETCNEQTKENCRAEFGDFLEWACDKCEMNTKKIKTAKAADE